MIDEWILGFAVLGFLYSSFLDFYNAAEMPLKLKVSKLCLWLACSANVKCFRRRGNS